MVLTPLENARERIVREFKSGRFLPKAGPRPLLHIITRRLAQPAGKKVHGLFRSRPEGPWSHHSVTSCTVYAIGKASLRLRTRSSNHGKHFEGRGHDVLDWEPAHQRDPNRCDYEPAQQGNERNILTYAQHTCCLHRGPKKVRSRRCGLQRLR